MSHAELYVKGYPLYGKNSKIYNEIKEEFLNKKVSRFKQKVMSKSETTNLPIDENFKEKNIFEYLNSIRKVNEVFFIRFEPCETKTHKSTLNLTGGPIPHDTNELYSMTFTDFSNQSQRLKTYLKIQIPNESTSKFESFYLFAY